MIVHSPLCTGRPGRRGPPAWQPPVSSDTDPPVRRSLPSRRQVPAPPGVLPTDHSRAGSRPRFFLPFCRRPGPLPSLLRMQFHHPVRSRPTPRSAASPGHRGCRQRTPMPRRQPCRPARPGHPRKKAPPPFLPSSACIRPPPGSGPGRIHLLPRPFRRKRPCLPPGKAHTGIPPPELPSGEQGWFCFSTCSLISDSFSSAPPVFRPRGACRIAPAAHKRQHISPEVSRFPVRGAPDGLLLRPAKGRTSARSC